MDETDLSSFVDSGLSLPAVGMRSRVRVSVLVGVERKHLVEHSRIHGRCRLRNGEGVGQREVSFGKEGEGVEKGRKLNTPAYRGRSDVQRCPWCEKA